MNQWTESLWGDESFSAVAVQQPFGEMLGIVMRDTAPPLFYLLGFSWGRIFGFSEVALRGLNLLLMLGAGVFVGLIVYQLQKKKLEAILAGLLAFGAPFVVPFAFEWRMYALLTFTVMGSVYFFVAKKWWGYVVLTTAMLYTHHFGVFTLVGEGLLFLVEWWPRRRWREWWPFLVVVGLYLPWLYPFYIQLSRVRGGGFWLSVPRLNEVADLMYRFVTGGIRKEWQGVVGLIGATLLLGKDWKVYGKSWMGLATVFLLPVGLAWLVSYLVTPIFYDRYLLSVVMGMMILLVLGTRAHYWPVAAILVLAFYYQSFQQFNQPNKRPFRELAAEVKRELRPEDYLISWNGKAHHLWETKYYGLEAPIYVPVGELPLYVGTAQMKPEDMIKEIPTVQGRVGVIASESVEAVGLPGMKLVEAKEWGELRLSWWQKQ